MTPTARLLDKSLAPAWRARDLVTLTKPNITLMSVVVAAGSMAIVGATTGRALSPVSWVLVLAGIALSVMGAGALNMALEHALDARMARTKNRPIAAGRISPEVGFVLGGLLSLFALVLLAMTAPALTVALTFVAQVSYVAIYTPMKQKSAWAVVVGAVPGALPILMGTTAMTGRIESVGLCLFAVMVIWQLPHFMAITIYRRREYTAAGYRVAAESMGLEWTKTAIVATTALLVAVSLMLGPLGAAGFIYSSAAAVVGLWFAVLVAAGYAGRDDARWARKVFLGSLVYQMVLFCSLGLDAVVRGMGA